jgi:hypothetical protein
MGAIVFMTKFLKSFIDKVKEAYNCNHTVGLFYDCGGTDTVLESELTTDEKDRYQSYYVGEVDFFHYCPDCGERLPYKEKYKDAVEVVQMPS